jgi:hypothetical protein
MLRVIIVVAVVAVALLRGGTLRHFAALPIRRAPLAIAGFVLQPLAFLLLARISALAWATVPIYLLSMALLCAWVLLNWRIPGMPLIAAGLLMNLLAVAANGGHMPVDPAAARLAGRYADLVGLDPLVSKHQLAVAGQVRLWPLTDTIALPAALPFAPVWSPGDIVLTAGIALLCYRTIRRSAAPLAPTSDTQAALSDRS